MPRARLFLTLAVTLHSPMAPAAVRSFGDDFESGELLVSDAGQWDHGVAAPSISLQATGAAAHRGAFGYRFIDGADGGSWGYLGEAIDPTMTAFNARYWLRVSAGALPSSALSASATIYNTSAYSMFDVDLNPGPLLWMDGWTSAQTQYIQWASAPLPNATWALIEEVVSGIGSPDAGTSAFYVNGQSVAAYTGVDFSAGISEFRLGIPWNSDTTLTHTLDFDDVRFGASPLASTLKVSATATLTQGKCAPITVTLVDSISGAPAPAPYAFDAALSASGVSGLFYADSRCSSATASASFASGAPSATAYFSPTSSGTALLGATYVDFLSAPGAWPVSSHTPGGAAYAVGCGCSAGDGRWLFGAVLLLWALRRR